MVEKIGRNEPCPCGSGRKFKHCCLGGQPRGQSEPASPIDDLIRALEAGAFANLDEAQAALQQETRGLNERPREDFVGLSPVQMDAVLYRPFDSPEFVTFPDPVPVTPHCAATDLALWLAEELGDEGVRRTVSGNLPRAASRRILSRWADSPWNDGSAEPDRLRSETDFPALHRMRVLMELAGLIRKHRGSFLLTRAARRRITPGGAASLYPLLLQTHAQRLNWAWMDYHAEAPMLQQTFLFSLWLLHCFGDDWHPVGFYADAVLRAFPMLLDDFPDTDWQTPEQGFENAYQLRMFHRFAEFFGLVEIWSSDPADLLAPREARRTPLLRQAVQFQVARPDVR